MTEATSAEIAELQALLAAKDAENSVLASENGRLKRDLGDRNETLKSMQNEMTELATTRKECDELKRSLDVKSQQYAHLVPEYNKVKEEYLRLVPEIVQSRAERLALASELEAEKGTNARTAGDNESLRKETDAFFGKYKAAETKVGQLQAELEKKQKEIDEQRRLVEILREQFRAADTANSNNEPPVPIISDPPRQSADTVPMRKEPAEAALPPTEAEKTETLAAIASEFSALIMMGIMSEFSAVINSAQVTLPQSVNAGLTRVPSRIPTPALLRALGQTAKPYKPQMGKDIRWPYHPYQAAHLAQKRQPLPVPMPAVKRPGIPVTKKSRSSLLATYRAAAAARRNALEKVTAGCPSTPHGNDVTLSSKWNESGSKKLESPAMAAYRTAAASRRKPMTEGLGLAEKEPNVASDDGQQQL